MKLDYHGFNRTPWIMRKKKYNETWLKEILQNVDGIIDVNAKNGAFLIGCSRDATSEIARSIVESGVGLNYLNKKEYGLDDIYYRYFEGGEEND